MKILLLITLILIGCGGEDTTYTRSEVCTVDHITDDIITLDCNGIYRDVYSDGGDYYYGQPLKITIEEYAEIENND